MKTFVDLSREDALIVIGLQKDFLPPDGALAVPGGTEVIPVMNGYIRKFTEAGIPVFLTRELHPEHHISFRERGGPWPPHCVTGTRGAEFADGLDLPDSAVIVTKDDKPELSTYSGFGETDLHERLQKLGVKRLFIGGLATDYCVLNTVRDAQALGYKVMFLTDATRAVNVEPEDGENAIWKMVRGGAEVIRLDNLIED